MQASIGVSDGERLWAIRYSTEGTLAHAVRFRRRDAIRAPCIPRTRACSGCSDEDRVVVSEPLADLPGAWRRDPGVDRR